MEHAGNLGGKARFGGEADSKYGSRSPPHDKLCERTRRGPFGSHPLDVSNSSGPVLPPLSTNKCLHRFHPAAQRVKEIIDSGELGSIKSIKADFAVPSLFSSLFFLKDDVRYNYDLGGGCTMDMGGKYLQLYQQNVPLSNTHALYTAVYPLSALRYFTGNEPLEVCASASLLPTDPTRIDRGMHATLAFPSSVTGELYCDFAMPGWGPLSIVPRMLKATVLITLEGGEIEFFGFPLPHIYHSIKVRPKRGKSRTERVYRHPDGGGQDWWSSYVSYRCRSRLFLTLYGLRGQLSIST